MRLRIWSAGLALGVLLLVLLPAVWPQRNYLLPFELVLDSVMVWIPAFIGGLLGMLATRETASRHATRRVKDL